MGKIKMPIDTNLKNLLALPPVAHLGMVVQDISKSTEYYSEIFGIGPWSIESPKFINQTYRGRAVDFSWEVAFAKQENVTWELIMVTKGPTVYEDDLGKGGEGLHHLGYLVPDIDKTVEAAKKLGIEIIQAAQRPEVKSKWAYLDTRFIAGVTIELVQKPYEQKLI